MSLTCRVRSRTSAPVRTRLEGQIVDAAAMTDVESGRVSRDRAGSRRHGKQAAGGRRTRMADADRVSGRARKRGGGGDDDFRALREAIETEVPSFGQIAEMLELARRRDRLNFAERIVDRRLQEIGDDAIHWTVPDRLSGYRDLLVESKTLVRLKYGFEECPADIDILAVADRMAHRVVPDPVALDRLFAVSRSGVERDEWESQVRQAFVIDQIVNDRNEIGLPGAAVLAPIRPGAWDAIAREIRDADRIVCLVFHSGFLSITRFLYAQIPSSAAIRGRAHATRRTVAERQRSQCVVCRVQGSARWQTLARCSGRPGGKADRNARSFGSLAVDRRRRCLSCIRG